jgi:asparagine synthase (glutamine-hydrolysing)
MMHGLTGWFAVSDVSAQDFRSGFDALRRVKPAHAAHVEVGERWALGASSERSLTRSDDLTAIVVGRPRYSDPALRSLEPAKALAQLWRRHGQDTLQHIHGTFALVVLDHLKESVHLAIDRVGACALAFAVLGDGLVFATRADVVAAHPRLGAQIDPQGLFNYFYFHVVPAPGTVFRGVEKLQPAQWLSWRQGVVSRGHYWRLHFEDERGARQDFQAQSTRLRQTLRDCVARAKGDDDVAAFLSGGTDSSTVCGLLSETEGTPARSYSIGFQAQGFDEMEYARLAARRFRLDAREYYLKPEDILTAIPVIAGHYDEPFGNDSAVPSLFCAQLASADGYRVMLAGDGGDEIFGGNARYAKQKVFEAYNTLPAALRHGVIEPLAHLGGVSRLAPGRKLQSYIRQANVPLPERLQSYNFVHRQSLDQMFSAAFLAEVNPELPVRWQKEEYDRADSHHFINRMLHLDLKFTLADNDLRKVNGMTEAAGVEVRYPLLDDALVEFSGEIPPRWKVRGQKLRWFWKESLRGFLPDAILDKTKHGFGLPFGVWAREHPALRERVEDRLSDFAARRLLDPAYIRRIREEHVGSHATYFGTMVWVIMILEEWLALRRI